MARSSVCCDASHAEDCEAMTSKHYRDVCPRCIELEQRLEELTCKKSHDDNGTIKIIPVDNLERRLFFFCCGLIAVVAGVLLVAKLQSALIFIPFISAAFFFQFLGSYSILINLRKRTAPAIETGITTEALDRFRLNR